MLYGDNDFVQLQEMPLNGLPFERPNSRVEVIDQMNQHRGAVVFLTTTFKRSMGYLNAHHHPTTCTFRLTPAKELRRRFDGNWLTGAFFDVLIGDPGCGT